MASPILMWHPASLLLVWILFALALQWATLAVLFVLCILFVGLSAAFARERSYRLFRRTRWLMLSLAVLFVFFSSGEYVPGAIGRSGMTYEGLQVAGEHLARLIVMLASLALLHERLGTSGLMAGLYALVAPFPMGRKTVVRLMLVLESVEQKPAATWREWLEDSPAEVALSGTCTLEVRKLAWWDKTLMGVALTALLWWVFWT